MEPRKVIKPRTERAAGMSVLAALKETQGFSSRGNFQ